VCSAKVVVGPRNHLNLLNGLVVFIEWPVFFPSKVEDSGKIAIEVDFQLSLLVGPQFDPVDERAQNICGFAPVFLPVQHLSKVCYLLAVFHCHVRMKQDRLFLVPASI
jgi:hypothetical protein